MSDSQGTIKVLFINAGGQGFSERLEVPEGTTVATLFAQKMGNAEAPVGYTTLVRRGVETYGGDPGSEGQFPLPADFVLAEDDRVSILPAKMVGAAN